MLASLAPGLVGGMYASSRIGVAHFSQFGGAIRGILASRDTDEARPSERAADDLKESSWGICSKLLTRPQPCETAIPKKPAPDLIQDGNRLSQMSAVAFFYRFRPIDMRARAGGAVAPAWLSNLVQTAQVKSLYA
jgi:hypothetical protein